MAEPFSTQSIVIDEFFTDREREVARVLEAMRTRGRIVLYGERRMGKSSVIARAANRIRSEGGVVLAADAWTIDGLDDLNRAVMQGVPSDWLVGERLSRLLRALRSMVSVSADESGRPVLQFSGTAPRDGDADERLGRILRALDEIAGEYEAPVVVVIDEFQRLEDVQAGSGGLLRGIVQETRNLSYVFAGSIVGLVMDLLGPKGPFHAIERLEVTGIDRDHLVRWLRHRFETHGAVVSDGGGAAIYDLAGPVTEYVMRLAKVVYRRGRDHGTVTPAVVHAAFDEVVADHTGSFELIWDGLSSAKRQVLRAVADGEQKLNSREVLEVYDIGSSSTATYAINELRRDGLLAPGKPHRVSDPFLAAWVRRRS
jgi:hypothetical protein